jgi:hypothetical protein
MEGRYYALVPRSAATYQNRGTELVSTARARQSSVTLPPNCPNASIQLMRYARLLPIQLKVDQRRRPSSHWTCRPCPPKMGIDANPIVGSLWLLRTRGQRPRHRRPAEKRDELAPFHSINCRRDRQRHNVKGATDVKRFCHQIKAGEVFGTHKDIELAGISQRLSASVEVPSI